MGNRVAPETVARVVHFPGSDNSPRRDRAGLTRYAPVFLFRRDESRLNGSLGAYASSGDRERDVMNLVFAEAFRVWPALPTEGEAGRSGATEEGYTAFWLPESCHRILVHPL